MQGILEAVYDFSSFPIVDYYDNEEYEDLIEKQNRLKFYIKTSVF